MNRLRLLSAIVGVLGVAMLLGSYGGSQAPSKKSVVPRITVEELKECVDKGEDIVIGDTRSLAAYEERHIEGANLIPEDPVETSVLGSPLDQEIVLYCT